MKKILFGLAAIVGLSISLHSCKEEIELDGDFIETAVVYALLDVSETTHIMKITRAFIGPGNSYDFAQIPDSSYFPNLEGTVTELNNGLPTGVSWELIDTTVTNKDPNGAFYAPEQKLYYFNGTLNQNNEYRLDLDINNGEFTVTSTTELVRKLSEAISGATQPYKFVDNSNIPRASNVHITSTQNAYKLEINLRVEFTEWIGSTATVKSFTYRAGTSDCQENSDKIFAVNGQTFMANITAACTDDPLITKRTFNSITTVFTGGSEDLAEYISVNEPSTDLTQSKPSFTNLEASGDFRAVGLFTSRSTKSVFKPFIDPTEQANVRVIDKKTTRYLCQNLGLLFCSDHPGDLSAADNAWNCN
ncbi:MAG: hypothetical protein QNK85_00275 [Crocinitomicaceae bacterium]